MCSAVLFASFFISAKEDYTTLYSAKNEYKLVIILLNKLPQQHSCLLLLPVSIVVDS